MDNSTIGIKIADGTYFPVLEGESNKKKKLVLTTVNDDQSSVQIDLYKGEGKNLTEALYIGSLVIEDIMPEMKGEPEIELIIGVDEDGTLNAVAGDTGSGEKQSLSVSLESLEDNEFESPNFELDETVFDDVPSFEEDFSFEDVPSLDDESSFGEVADFEDESILDEAEVFDDSPSFDDDSVFEDLSESGDENLFDEESSFDDLGSEAPFEDKPVSTVYESNSETYPDENKKKRSPLAIIILVILILAILGLGAFLILRGINGGTVPPLEAENTSAVTEPEPEAPVVEVAVEEAVEEIPEPDDVIETKNNMSMTEGIPPAGQGGGVWYRLKWGDTLWDLSNSFYRTPWLYSLIAVENDIKNPDIIYAGVDILIPEN